MFVNQTSVRFSVSFELTEDEFVSLKWSHPSDSHELCRLCPNSVWTGTTLKCDFECEPKDFIQAQHRVGLVADLIRRAIHRGAA